MFDSIHRLAKCATIKYVDYTPSIATVFQGASNSDLNTIHSRIVGEIDTLRILSVEVVTEVS